MSSRAAPLLSWGRYPPHPQRELPLSGVQGMAAALAGAQARHGSTLAYGAGRSYGDSCLAASDHVLPLRPLNQVLELDARRGVLRAQAGATLDEVLTQTIPQGWYLPVSPGTKQVTLGGAVANDVHGKNHHSVGSFGRHVRCLRLLRSDGTARTCSLDEHTEWFQATVGGLGLSGLIEWVELQLRPISSSRVEGVTQRFDTLDEFFALSDELEPSHEFAVAWVDCTATGAAFGRGVYTAANFAARGPLTVERRAHGPTLPLTPPFSLVNGWSVRAFNALHWRRAPSQQQAFGSGYDTCFYPLDGIGHWNRMYGRRGFQQYQAVIPRRNEQDGIRSLLAAVSAFGGGSFLAVLKRCGSLASPGWLSFPMEGTTLALDFPHSDGLATGLFPRLDAIVREAGGRLYPAKDAHMSGADFRRAYPAWQRLEALRDPALLSRFWQRVMQ
jgi:FAD/FMN-containing dehydrogenase